MSHSCYLPPRPGDLPSDPTPSGVYPLVNLGDPLTGLNADSGRLAFAKYNQHTHAEAGDGSFLYYPLRVGERVTTTPVELLPADTRLTWVGPNQLHLSRPPLGDGDATLVGERVTVPNCLFRRGDPVVCRLPRAGFLSPTLYSRLQRRRQRWYHPGPRPGRRYPILLGEAEAQLLQQVSTYAAAGGATLQLQAADWTLNVPLGPEPVHTPVQQTLPAQTPLWAQLLAGGTVEDCYVEVEILLLY